MMTDCFMLILFALGILCGVIIGICIEYKGSEK